MALVRINYYDDYDLDSVEIYEVEENILLELNNFLKNGVCKLDINNKLNQYIAQKNYSRESACCYFIEKNSKKINFTDDYKFKTNLK